MGKLPNRSLFIFLLVIFSLSSCSGGESQAVMAIESYIQALSDKDAVQISNLSCGDWERTALREVDSLTAVGSKVENMSCKEAGQEGIDIFVSCNGVIALDYDGEIQQIELSDRTYIARQEGSEWRMCGYR